MEKSPLFMGAIRRINGSTGVSMAPLATKEHARQRKALGVSFTTQTLLQQQHILLFHVKNLMSRLEAFARNGTAIEITDWCKRQSANIL